MVITLVWKTNCIRQRVIAKALQSCRQGCAVLHPQPREITFIQGRNEVVLVGFRKTKLEELLELGQNPCPVNWCLELMF